MANTTPSREDYLEVILELTRQGESARSIDIASALGYSRASVSRAVGLLKRDGFIEQEPYGQVTLTPLGMEKALSVRRRHDLLKYYLLHIIEVDEATAEDDACRMEHVVSNVTLKKMEEQSVRHMEKFHPEQHQLFSQANSKPKE